MKKSTILKKVTFKIFSSVFTLCAQSILENRVYAFYSSQILSNLITSAILNYGLVRLIYLNFKIVRWCPSFLLCYVKIFFR